MGEEMDAGKFPAGMRVLAVDDDSVSLMILEKQLKHCNYNGERSRLLGHPCKFSSQFHCDRDRGRGQMKFPSGFLFLILLELLWCMQ